jgi:hypothetical protein
MCPVLATILLDTSLGDQSTLRLGTPNTVSLRSARQSTRWAASQALCRLVIMACSVSGLLQCSPLRFRPALCSVLCVCHHEHDCHKHSISVSNEACFKRGPAILKLLSIVGHSCINRSCRFLQAGARLFHPFCISSLSILKATEVPIISFILLIFGFGLLAMILRRVLHWLFPQPFQHILVL